MKSSMDEGKQENYQRGLEGEKQWDEISKSQRLSPHINQYQKFFKNSNPKVIESFRFQLQKNKITYNQNNCQETPQFTILSHSNYYQAVCLLVSFSYFKFELMILNVDQNSPTIKNLTLIGRGGYSEVYKLPCLKSYQDKSIALKCTFLKMNQKQLIGSILQGIIVQFCFYKLFSVLKIGPYIPTLFGFDLIIYKDFVEFAMQLCEKPKLNLTHDLIDGLATLHMLNIIHGDIKPQNIMWSESYNKNVFLDFGFTKCINEKIGELSLTYFHGTYGYCCQQMKKIFCSNMPGEVDLYYNDVFALDKSFDHCPNEYEKRSQKKQFGISKHFECFTLNLRIIGFVFEANVIGILEFVKCFPSLTILQLTIKFLQQVDYSLAFAKILKILLDSYYFEQHLYKKIIKFSKIQSLQFLRTCSNKNFIERVNQLNTKFEDSTNDIMLFVFIYYEQDITPKAQQRALFLKGELFEKEIGIEFWQNLVEYLNNPYANFADVQKIYEIIKNKIFISEWKKSNIKELSFFNKSKQIAETVLQKFQINLFVLKVQIEQKQKQLIRFENLFHKLPFMDFLSDLKNEIKIAKVNKKQLNLHLLQKKYSKKFFQNFKKVLFLIKEALKVQNCDNVNYQSRFKFMENFKFFEAALRTRGLFWHQKAIFQVQIQKFIVSNRIWQEISFSLKFFSLLFDCFYCLQTCAYDQIEYRLFKGQMSEDDFEKKVQAIYQFVNKFENQSVFESTFQILDKVNKSITSSFGRIAPINYYKSLYEIFFKILKEAKFSFSFKTAYTVNSLLCHLPPFVLQDKINVVLNILSKQNHSFIDVNCYDKYCFIIQKLSLYQQFHLKNPIQLLQMYRQYIHFIQQEEDPKIKYSYCKVLLLIEYIILACDKGENPRLEILDLCSFAFETIMEEEGIQRFMAVFKAISTYYSQAPPELYDEYFRVVMNVIKKSNKSSFARQQNWSIHFGLQILIFNFFDKQRQKSWRCSLLIYEKFQKLYKQNSESLCLNYPNSVILIIVLYKNYSINKFKISKQFVVNSLKIVSLMIDRCNFCMKRNFEKLMVHFVVQFTLDFLIENSQRKELVSRLRYFRCSKLYPFYFEIKKWFFQKISKNPNFLFQKKMRNKMSFINLNKEQYVESFYCSYLNDEILESYKSFFPDN